MKILWLTIILGLLAVTQASDSGPDNPPAIGEDGGADDAGQDDAEGGDTDSNGQAVYSSVKAPSGGEAAKDSPGAKSFRVRGKRPPLCPDDRYVKWQPFCPKPEKKCYYRFCLYKAKCAYYKGFYFYLYRPLYFWGYPCQRQGSPCKNDVYGGYQYNCYCRTYWKWVERRRWFYQDICGKTTYYLKYVYIRVPWGCYCQGSKSYYIPPYKPGHGGPRDDGPW
ncbi:uncharacterized protein LOC120326478 [Styela clava]|uniref:uncharacterized protein LOC120326478 n=1 Tax=Styela clava TaxID=7725 RepID=UPI001939EEAA|nr:uncharacterized protein LOC120326478 [Styela clava]